MERTAGRVTAVMGRLARRAVMQRLGSTAAISLLGLLVVGGLLALLVLNVRGARAAADEARVAESAAIVTSDAIALLTAVQTERGSAALLAAAPSAEAADRYEEAIVRTDQALERLRLAWLASPDLQAGTGRPSMTDALAAAETLDEIRAAARDLGGESTFEAYVSVVDMVLAATQGLGDVASNGGPVARRNALAAVLRATEALGRQRALVSRVAARGDRLTPEEAVRLSLLERDLQVNVGAARSLLDAPFDGQVAAVVSGPQAVQAEVLLRAIQEGRTAEVDVEPSAWFAEATDRIDALAAVAVALTAELRKEAANDVGRSRQALLVRSLGLGSLLLVAVVAALAAVFASIERVRALREYAELASGLQGWFLPETLVDVPGLRFAARYLPSSERTKAGGDWYDTYLLGPGRVAMVIGDVAGHGPQASAQMAEVRNLLRGQTIAYPLPPAKQVELLEATLEGSDVFATLLFGIFDLDAGTFTYSRAGHLPALALRPDGTVEVLDGGLGPPVGTGLVSARVESRLELEPQSVLVLYTDGLVESRRSDLASGIDSLVAAVPAATTDLEELAEVLVAARPDTANEDDIAMLLVRWVPAAV